MLNFCIFVFIIYAVASSVRAILSENFLINIIMFAKAFKTTENENKKPAKKSEIIRIKQYKPQTKIAEISNQTENAA